MKKSKQHNKLSEVIGVIDGNSSKPTFDLLNTIEMLVAVMNNIKELQKNENEVRRQLQFKGDLIFQTSLDGDLLKNSLDNISRYLDNYLTARAMLDYQNRQDKNVIAI